MENELVWGLGEDKTGRVGPGVGNKRGAEVYKISKGKSKEVGQKKEALLIEDVEKG